MRTLLCWHRSCVLGFWVRKWCAHGFGGCEGLMAYLYGRACLWLLLVCKYDLNYIEQIIEGHNGQYAL